MAAVGEGGMQYASGAVTRASELAKAGAAVARNAARWIADELGQMIDVPRWQTATRWSERLSAISWPRAGVALRVVAILTATVFIYVATRPDPYTPRLPGPDEIAARQQAIQNARRTPPPGLVEANKPVESSH